MAVARPLTRRSRRTRSELASAAHDQVARTGAVDVGAITGAAGVSPATFYAHFATHDDALAAAVDIALERIVGVGERLFHVERLLESGLAAVLDQLLRETHAVFQTESVVLRAALASLPRNRRIREVYRRHEARCLEHFAHQIELGQRAGVVRRGAADLRARSLLVVLQGFSNPLLTRGPLDPEVADDLRRVLGALLAPER
ncbi:MAG: TetR/AcrR family transcriptional regulator [Acidobacteria bacterium]|nr:MAG: TetR/AcrR family transcriptional regulator [Acidobacteriota bacterium]REK07096.1 MAG: TetR/AcrR family transcriptional regulator [Acidobacteriota bacterium]